MVKLILLHCTINLLFAVYQFASAYNVENYLLPRFVDGNQMTKTWSVKLDLDVAKDVDTLHSEASLIAKELGLVNLGQVGQLKGHYVFASNLSGFAGEFKKHDQVLWKNHQEILRRSRRYPIKESRSFRLSTPTFQDPLYPDQWHLHNTLHSGKDCNVTGVWAYNITGKGVTVAVIDDGVEWKHPDLKENYCPEGSFDLNSDDDDPTPHYDKAEENKHGTRCAGEIAAAANKVCGIGIAYSSKFSGIRLLDGPMTDSLEATAFSKRIDINDIYSCSWGPEDDGKTVDGPRNLAQEALRHGVVAGRKGFGSIFVVAGGNGGDHDDNCNYDGYANSIYTITIGAVNEFGFTPSYSEKCTSILACTVSSGSPGRNIVTTDWTLGSSGQQCTTQHTGTSAATPLVAGMVALILETRPCLHWRDVQHIIVFGSVPLHHVPHSESKNENWVKNKAGLIHTNEHGFGLLNAWRLVTIAKAWEPVPWLTSFKPKCVSNGLAITHRGLVLRASMTQSDAKDHMLNTLETVLLTVTLTHPSRGSLKFIITCPSGTTSIIYPRKNDKSSSGLRNWVFNTVKCWGESAVGEYQLKVIDTSNNIKKPGKLKAFQFTLYGSKLTEADVLQKQNLIKEALSGIQLKDKTSYECQAEFVKPFITADILSERTLKLLAMLSGFIAFWCIYYMLEIACCYEEEKKPDDNEAQSNT